MAAEYLTSWFTNAVRFISAAPVLDGESVAEIQSKQLMAGVLLLGFFIALLLGSLEWFAGEKLAAFLDTVFCLELLAIYLYLRITGRHTLLVLYAAVIGVMATPPAVTLALGGFVDSGARVMWTFLGPLGLLVFRRQKTPWFSFAVCLVTVSAVILFGGTFREATPSRLNTEMMATINIVGLLTYLFILLSTYVTRLRREQVRTTELLGELQAANAQMSVDVQAAADYVRSLIPRSEHHPLIFDWRWVPATDLGGDSLGFHGIDDDHIAAYIIDVTGHGLYSALLSVSIINVLRSGSLPNTDFKDPGAVLAALNERFQGDEQDHKLFTIWYGVFDIGSRELKWAGGGHPDAFLFEEGVETPVLLPSTGLMLGVMPTQQYATLRRTLNGSGSIYLYSDGVYEIKRLDGSFWSLADLAWFLQTKRSAGTPIMDRLLDHVRDLHGSLRLDDDFTMLEVKYYAS